MLCVEPSFLRFFSLSVQLGEPASCGDKRPVLFGVAQRVESGAKLGRLHRVGRVLAWKAVQVKASGITSQLGYLLVARKAVE